MNDVERRVLERLNFGEANVREVSRDLGIDRIRTANALWELEKGNLAACLAGRWGITVKGKEELKQND